MRKYILLISVLAVASGVAAATSERGKWRLEALALKATGRMPVRSWSEVVRGLFRCDAEPCIDKIVRGQISIAEFDTANPCPVLWETPLGPIRGLFEDHHVLEHFATQSWIVDPAAPRVRPGDTVLEVGAWLGAFTRAALNQGAKLVVAMEPEPINRNCFEQTFAPEIRAGRVIVIDKAARHAAGPVHMADIGPNAVKGSRKGFGIVEQGPIKAEAVTIDELVSSLDLDHLDFINMDIEGSETYALEGARQTIRKFRPVIVACIHHLPADRDGVPRTVLAIEPGYKVEITELQGYFRPAQRVHAHAQSRDENSIRAGAGGAARIRN